MKSKINKIQKIASHTLALVFIFFATQSVVAQERHKENNNPPRENNNQPRVNNNPPRANNNPPRANNNPQRQFNHNTVTPQTRSHYPNENRQQTNHQAPNRPSVVNRPDNRMPGVGISRTATSRPGVGVHQIANRTGYRPRGWAPTRRAYSRPPVVFGGRRYYSYHRYYPHPYTPFYYGPRWHPYGFFLPSLIGAAIAIDFENRHYYYDEGVFYEPFNNGYQVIPAPPGAYVPSLPAGFQQLMVGGETYFYFGGAFFVSNGGNYEVVQAPAGAVVYNLPEGATTEQVDNYSYLQFNGTYYQPIQVNGQDAYEVVELEQDTQQ
jgi:hypothetical protein